MEVIVQRDYEQMSKAAAQIVAELLNTKPSAVLGMATGSTPLGLYQELVRLHKREQLDFSRVTTFNLDEYVGLQMNRSEEHTSELQSLTNLVCRLLLEKKKFKFNETTNVY